MPTEHGPTRRLVERAQDNPYNDTLLDDADALDARSAWSSMNTAAVPGSENEYVRDYLAGYARSAWPQGEELSDPATWSEATIREYIAGTQPRWPTGEQAAEQLARAILSQWALQIVPSYYNPPSWDNLKDWQRDLYMREAAAVLKRLAEQDESRKEVPHG